MRTSKILLSIALIGLLGSSASAHHVRGTTRHHAHGVAYPRQAYYWKANPWQGGPSPSYSSRPALQSLGGYCPPRRIIPYNRDADNARDVTDGECD